MKVDAQTQDNPTMNLFLKTANWETNQIVAKYALNGLWLQRNETLEAAIISIFQDEVLKRAFENCYIAKPNQNPADNATLGMIIGNPTGYQRLTHINATELTAFLNLQKDVVLHGHLDNQRKLKVLNDIKNVVDILFTTIHPTNSVITHSPNYWDAQWKMKIEIDKLTKQTNLDLSTEINEIISVLDKMGYKNTEYNYNQTVKNCLEFMRRGGKIHVPDSQNKFEINQSSHQLIVSRYYMAARIMQYFLNKTAGVADSLISACKHSYLTDEKISAHIGASVDEVMFQTLFGNFSPPVTFSKFDDGYSPENHLAVQEDINRLMSDRSGLIIYLPRNYLIENVISKVLFQQGPLNYINIVFKEITDPSSEIGNYSEYNDANEIFHRSMVSGSQTEQSIFRSHHFSIAKEAMLKNMANYMVTLASSFTVSQ